MTKFKTLFALCIVVAIVSTCILSASAALSRSPSLSSSTSVHWNANETAAWAKTVAYGPSIANFYAEAYIKSMSTLQESRVRNTSGGSTTSVTATTSSVSVTYPSPIPLVNYSGSHGFVN